MSIISRYSKRQYLLFLVLCFINFFNALSYSLQAPFYPFEAELKGATPTQYSLVFSVYNLVIFLATPVYGWLIPKVGAKLTTVVGLFTLSVTCSLFGITNLINGTEKFISYSFIIRILEATGSAAIETGLGCIVVAEFPYDVGFAYSLNQTAFGLGMIIGPLIGSLLYEVGGFTLPFVVLGGIFLFASILVCAVLPEIGETQTVPSSKSLFSLLKDIRVILGIMTVLGVDFILGTILPLLEPHLSGLDFSPVQIGYLCLLIGVACTTSSIFWGKLCDIWDSPHYIWCIGCVMFIFGLTILGPTPYMPFNLSVPLAYASMPLIGLGIGASVSCALYCFNQQAIKAGYPKDLNTQGFISALYCTLYSLGTFIGSACGGFLFDNIGFPWTLQLLVIYEMTLLILTFLHARHSRKMDESRVKLIN